MRVGSGIGGVWGSMNVKLSMGRMRCVGSTKVAVLQVNEHESVGVVCTLAMYQKQNFCTARRNHRINEQTRKLRLSSAYLVVCCRSQ